MSLPSPTISFSPAIVARAEQLGLSHHIHEIESTSTPLINHSTQKEVAQKFEEIIAQDWKSSEELDEYVHPNTSHEYVDIRLQRFF